MQQQERTYGSGEMKRKKGIRFVCIQCGEAVVAFICISINFFLLIDFASPIAARINAHWSTKFGHQHHKNSINEILFTCFSTKFQAISYCRLRRCLILLNSWFEHFFFYWTEWKSDVDTFFCVYHKRVFVLFDSHLLCTDEILMHRIQCTNWRQCTANETQKI